MNILISACLLGVYCRYDGRTKQYEAVAPLLQQEKIHLIPICPEQAGGLSTPRTPAERQGEHVVTCDGQDVTQAYQKGAEQALYLAKLFHCSYAVLKEKSPSCGSGVVYDGTFTRTLQHGDGVTAALLRRHGITVIGESGIASLLQKLR